MISGAVSLVLLALQTPFHASYLELWSSDVVAWGWIFVPVWSVWISYRGVVLCFDVRPVAARVWFLILPWFLYCGVMALLFTIGVLGSL